MYLGETSKHKLKKKLVLHQSSSALVLMNEKMRV